MLKAFFLLVTLYKITNAELAEEDMQLLNELPLEKLIRLKSSLQELVTETYENVTSTTPPSYLENFGAQAMAMKSSPIKRTSFAELHKKTGSTKISNIFSMSVTTLAFLAFGGYLLCLIVQAIKAKETYYNTTTVQPTTFFINAGLKKKPQSQFSAYGRRKRENRKMSLKQTELVPGELFSALLQLCEGYVKWSGQL